MVFTRTLEQFVLITIRPYQQTAINEAWAALKKNNDPVLFVSSVGSGKSVMIGHMMKTIEDHGKRALCLVNSSELVRNNSETFKRMGGNPSVFCASLNKKEYDQNIVFATPQSIMAAIKNNHPIKDIFFNMIVVDEAHSINHLSFESQFMRILRHYKQAYPAMRVLGLTGTDFRGSGNDIVGEDCLFKTRVANITTSWLIQNDFLAKPIYGFPETKSFDFSKLKTKAGKFSTKELEEVISKKKRLTWHILQEVNKTMQSRNGAFIFCSSKRHCGEALEALPPDSAYIITGNTPEKERHNILTMARNQEIKYLISVNCLMTGIDVPNFCTTVWLRPTESLVLYVQGIGRALRLHESKKNALILDFAGNLDRHQDIDNLIINEALQARDDHEEEEEKPFTCYTCGTAAGLHTRRCHGVVLNARCEYFFQFKDCPKCSVQNDITSRHCRSCSAELIDPNTKLKRIKPQQYILNVIKAHYGVQPMGYTSNPIVNVSYDCGAYRVYESYFTNNSKNKNIMYAKFLRLHVDNASDYYMHMGNINKMRELLGDKIKTPSQLICTLNEDGFYKIVKKVF